MTGAAFDALENLVSFVMLADPQGFADGLALPYSTFAVAKFVCLASAMALVLVTLLLVVAGRIMHRPALG